MSFRRLMDIEPRDGEVCTVWLPGGPGFFLAKLNGGSWEPLSLADPIPAHSQDLWEPTSPRGSTCLWRTDDTEPHTDMWMSECGHHHEFQDSRDDPWENGFNYCPFCGRELALSSEAS